MPSLDKLQINSNFDKLEIFPINVGNESIEKSKNFFEDLRINNLELYFDKSVNLTKKFSLRGIPTTIFINRDGEEFARIIGSTDFEDKEFLEWLKSFN